MKRLGRWIPPWYFKICALALSIMTVIMLAYMLGAGGIRSSGVTMSFNRDKDQGQLFRIDGRHAMLVDSSGYVILVKYRRSPLPLFFCGCYEPAGHPADGSYDTALLDLDAKQVAQRFPRLWTLKESCMILAMALYAILIILALMVVPVVVLHRRKLAREAAK